MRQGRADKSGNAGWKTEPKSKCAEPEGVAQLGLAVQFKKEEVIDGPGYVVRGPTRAEPGPGGGRTIHKCGSQGRH